MIASRTKWALNVIWLSAFLILIEAWIGWPALLHPWLEQPTLSILGAICLLYISYSVRAIRLYSYFKLEAGVSYTICFKLILQHNFFNNLLPMRSGEISFPLLMQRYFGTPMIRSTSALLWFRVLDLHTILGLAAYFLIFFDVSFLLFLPAVMAWLCLPWLLYFFSIRLRTYLSNHGQTSVMHFLNKILSALPESNAAFLYSWGWTLLNWLIKLVVLTGILRLFLDIPINVAWLGVIAGDLTSILPVHSVGGIGTYEAGIVGALLPFGISAEDAASGAVNLHFFVLSTAFLGYGIAQLIPFSPRETVKSK